MDIKWIGSPNYDTNRKPIKYIVIHWMAGNLAGTDKVFQDDARDTSAHYGIEDNVIHQYVKEEHVAYHAGNYAANQESIGIEHSASPDRAASEQTYQTSAKLIREICDRYNIPIDSDHLIPHNRFKATQCPGTMDIAKLINLAKGEVTNPTDGPALVAFDQSLIVLNEGGIIPTNSREDYIEENKYRDIIDGLIKETKRQSDNINTLTDSNNELRKKIVELNTQLNGCVIQKEQLEYNLNQCKKNGYECPGWLSNLNKWFCKAK